MRGHTPGWRIIGIDNTETVISDNYGPVARVFHADRSKSQYVGNYKLIAFAPELADALEDCLAQLELTGEPFLDEAVHAAHAALKKAGRR